LAVVVIPRYAHPFVTAPTLPPPTTNNHTPAAINSPEQELRVGDVDIASALPIITSASLTVEVNPTCRSDSVHQQDGVQQPNVLRIDPEMTTKDGLPAASQEQFSWTQELLEGRSN